MKITTVLSAVAAVVPAVIADNAFVPYALFPGSSELQEVNARGNQFFIGKPPTTIPPPWAADETFNTTIFSSPADSNTIWMGVLQAGGQQLYVQYQELYYTKVSPNGTAGGIKPNFDYETGFRIETRADGQLKLVNEKGIKSWHHDGPIGNDWTACQEGNQAYILAGDSSPRCNPFEMVLKPTDAPAPLRYASEEELPVCALCASG